MSARETELLSIAFDASYTHMYAPGTRRHIHNALQAGATMKEVMEVLKLCVGPGRAGVQSWRADSGRRAGESFERFGISMNASPPIILRHIAVCIGECSKPDYA